MKLLAATGSRVVALAFLLSLALVGSAAAQTPDYSATIGGNMGSADPMPGSLATAVSNSTTFGTTGAAPNGLVIDAAGRPCLSAP